MAIDSLIIYDWIGSHLHVAGWGTIIYAAWKFSRFLVKATNFITVILARFTAAEETLLQLATNDLPHIFEEMKEANQNLSLLRQSISLILPIMQIQQQREKD